MKEHYPNFDWLRLMFAIQVVAIHSGVWGTVFISPVAAFIGVSGFVVLGSLERHSAAQFFLNRALRVLPLLFVSFIAVWMLFGLSEMIHTVKFWIFPFFTSQPPINAVVWTLIYEEFFYVLLVIIVSMGAYRYRLLSIIFASIAIYCTISKNYFGLPSPLYFFGGAFFIGNAVFLYRREIKLINKWFAFVATVAMISFIQTIPYYAVVQPERALMDFLSIAIVLIFAVIGPQLPRLYIDISYSLYLVHCIVRAELLNYMQISTPQIFWFMLLASLPICYACWYLIESPFLRLKTIIPMWIERRNSSCSLVDERR